jgi:glycosyltransferase involved in cell wall biosynthesis
MRVLYFSRDYTTHDRRYLDSLAGAGYKVGFLRLERGAVAYEKREIPLGVQEISWAGGRCAVRPWMWSRVLRDLRRVLRDFKPDLVHAGPVPSCGFLAALAGAKPLVVMSWGSDVLVEAERNPVTRWLTRYTLRRADIVIGDCRAVREKVRALSGIPDDRIVTYPWGIDLQTFQPRRSSLGLREQLGWDRARVFLSTRSWEPPYRLDVLVAAFSLVARQVDDVCLVLLGDGSMAPQIRQMIAEGGHEARVHMAGQVPHLMLADYYNLADIYVSSVPNDGTSISLLEAMACGLPVIVVDAPGNREWVMPGKNGWLFEVDNPKALATAMLAALDRSAAISQMREANLALARAQADWKRNFQLLLSAYDRALRHDGVPASESRG